MAARTARRCLASTLLAALVAAAPALAAEGDDAAEWVRQVWFEGVPLDEARALSRPDCNRLIAMLADPAEALHHGKVIEALGASGRGGAFEAIRAHYAATDDAAPRTRRTRAATPHAAITDSYVSDTRCIAMSDGSASHPVKAAMNSADGASAIGGQWSGGTAAATSPILSMSFRQS